ncbi:hypothetical protein, partial [Alistipes putredinis]|uniref:hypothetical protein n=6 Tax=Rikenellaceae TaxID=171550 RepID=UPI003A8617DE
KSIIGPRPVILSARHTLAIIGIDPSLKRTGYGCPNDARSENNVLLRTMAPQGGEKGTQTNSALSSPRIIFAEDRTLPEIFESKHS